MPLGRDPARRDGRQRGRHAAPRKTYFAIRIWSAPLALANYVVLGWLIGQARAELALAVQIAINLINMAATVLLVLVLDAGIAGAAIAAVDRGSGRARCSASLIARQPRAADSSRVPRAALFDRAKLMRMLAVNRDIMIRTAALIAAFLFFTAQGARAGDVTLAANAVLNNFLLISAFFLDGLANAAEQLCGQAYGARDRSAFSGATRLVIAWGFGFALAVARCLRAVRPCADRHHDRERRRARAWRATILVFVVVSPLLARVRLRLRRRLYRRDLGARHAQPDAGCRSRSFSPRGLRCARSAMPGCGARCWRITPRAAGCRRCAIRRCCKRRSFGAETERIASSSYTGQSSAVIVAASAPTISDSDRARCAAASRRDRS